MKKINLYKPEKSKFTFDIDTFMKYILYEILHDEEESEIATVDEDKFEPIFKEEEGK